MYVYTYMYLSLSLYIYIYIYTYIYIYIIYIYVHVCSLRGNWSLSNTYNHTNNAPHTNNYKWYYLLTIMLLLILGVPQGLPEFGTGLMDMYIYIYISNMYI